MTGFGKIPNKRVVFLSTCFLLLWPSLSYPQGASFLTSQMTCDLGDYAETYFKKPGDDIYANGPVSYLRMDQLPEPGDYAPIIDTLSKGDYFVSSGEVLIPQHSFSGQGRDTVLEAEVEWTFPLDFIEVVYGNGEITESRVVTTPELSAFGSQLFRIEFDSTGYAWVRFAAWDSAGNGAMTMPVRLSRE